MEALGNAFMETGRLYPGVVFVRLLHRAVKFVMHISVHVCPSHGVICAITVRPCIRHSSLLIARPCLDGC